jgi:hypothetical protein
MDTTAQRFVLWALQSLGMEVQLGGHGEYTCTLKNSQRDAFGGAEQVSFSFEPCDPAGPRQAERMTFDSSMFQWLLKQLTLAGKPLHAAPVGQPQSVHEFSKQLFDAYEMDEGNVHLSGCTLSDRPFLRLTFLEQEDPASAAKMFTHVFMDVQGNIVDETLRASLGLDDLKPLNSPPHRLNEVDLQRWIAAGNKLYQASGRSAARRDLVAVAIIWCKQAEGKLSFRIRDAGGDVSFSGWAQLLKDSHVKPPPFTCPHSGETSYHVSVTDDGRLTVAEAIGICAETEQRVLKIDLETCEATGNRAVEDQFTTCPVSEQRVVRSALKACDECRQAVSPSVLESGRCTACRNPRRIGKDDPRMARVLGEYPELDTWRRWFISETAEVYVLNASALTKRLLVVVNKDSLEVLRAARRGPLSTNWIDLDDSERVALLR